ncbi:MAG: flavin reductase family protein [Clostridiaceae bacterium]|nr:flavin reductase family protein [Clostridiaceae bacterium]
MALLEIKPQEIKENTFQLIGRDFMLVSAIKKDGSINAMTASWGGFGVMWDKDVAFVVIRPQRYTKEFVDEADTLSLSFFDNSFKKNFAYFGTVSGRDEDKIKKTGLSYEKVLDAPVFENARMTIIGRKLFAQSYDENAFIDKGIVSTYYNSKDFHTLYIVKIEKVLLNE